MIANNKIILSHALDQLFQHFAGCDAEMTLSKDEVLGLTTALGEMTDVATDLEKLAAARPAFARVGLVASAMTLGDNVILFPITPHVPFSAA